MIFKELPTLIPEIDKAFEDFYDTLLKEFRYSDFFESDEQIKTLITMQKQHFEQMLRSQPEVIQSSYIKLGEYHFDINIPYVDFMKGTEILEKHFLLHAQITGRSTLLFKEIFEFFSLIKAYTAKGYLNKMIKKDREDISMFFDEANDEDEAYLPKKIVLQKIEWLRSLLDAIEDKSDYDAEKSNKYFVSWLNDIDFLTDDKKAFFEEIDSRIHSSTQNLFVFLKHKNFLEVLPLYTSLSNIYKLTLLLNNSITMLYANHMISDLRVDKLTGLYRKDMFEQIIFKELEHSKKDYAYHFSVAFFDLDDFKNINDTYGHYIGDSVLEELGKIILNNIRPSDMGFRIGGDELALVFKDISAEDTLLYLEKIHSDFQKIKLSSEENSDFLATISTGAISSIEKNFETITDIIKSVDYKLYDAKKNGKNRISM